MSGVSAPWDVLAMPDGRILFTERSERRIRVIEAGGALRAAPAWTEPAATKVLGMDRHPGYATNRWIYVYVTYGGGSRVLRLVDDGVDLRTDRVIFDRPIATDGNHDGGRIRFGPDGKLYVTTGDVHNPALPRDLSRLNGKILRMNDDGSSPADNPFASRGDDGRWVYSSGHRHPQGLAWDASGRLWASEHGPSGESYAPAGENTGNDELNLIVPGGDYGWPQSSGAVVAPGTRAPAWVAGSSAVAPGGLVFAPDGRLYAPMLAGEHLHVFRPDGDSVVDEGQLYPGTRLRAASMVGCELFFTTDRGAGNDEIRKVPISPCQSPATTTPTMTPAPTATPTPTPTPGTQLTTPGAGVRAAARRLHQRAERALRAIGGRGLARRSSFSVRVGGFPRGSLRFRVERAQRGRPKTSLASTARSVPGRSTLTVRPRTSRAGRALLRVRPRMRVRLIVSHRAAGASAWSRYHRTITLPRG